MCNPLGVEPYIFLILIADAFSGREPGALVEGGDRANVDLGPTF